MREKNFNTGLRGVLFEEQHYARMGSAIWLYGWLVLRQTHQTGTTGWVLGGAPVTYREIEGETGFNRRTLERWMSSLRRNAYIATEAAPGGVIVRILKAKKHIQVAHGANTNVNIAPRARKIAETVRRVAERGPQSCVASCGERHQDQHAAGGIGSALVGRIKEKEQSEIHRAVEIGATCGNENASEDLTNSQNHAADEIQDCERQQFQQQFQKALQNHDLKNLQLEKNNSASPNRNDCYHYGTQRLTDNPIEKQNHRPVESRPARPATQQTFSWQLRERMRLLRAERDEEVRRELAVGTGPEVRRP
jgi:hypothetical protein